MIKLLNVQKGGEAKFKNFKTSDKGQRKIVEFLKTVITENEKVKVTVYHKKYGYGITLKLFGRTAIC